MSIWAYYFYDITDKTYAQLWRTKQFRTFNHSLMEETFLLKKLSLVNVKRKVPEQVDKAIHRINDVRNDLAHGFFPEERRRYRKQRKVMYAGDDIFSKDGLEKFNKDVVLVADYLHRRAFGKRR